jgi:hypothetical protein
MPLLSPIYPRFLSKVFGERVGSVWIGTKKRDVKNQLDLHTRKGGGGGLKFEAACMDFFRSSIPALWMAGSGFEMSVSTDRPCAHILCQHALRREGTSLASFECIFRCQIACRRESTSLHWQRLGVLFLSVRMQ